MPELPEVETVARTLAPHLTGARIVSVDLRKSRVIGMAEPELWDLLPGREIASVSRRGKVILLSIPAQGTAPLSLGIHLGMTGKLLFNAEPTPHTRAVITLDRGELLYDDIRQFGKLELSAGVPPRAGRIGPDALAIEAAPFLAMLRSRRGRIKALLLNQGFLGGLGNIYVDEVLHRARIHPLAIASRISKDRAGLLHRAMGEILAEAIASGGSSISDYVDGDGRKGSFQDQHRVYGKEGDPCSVCGTPVRRIVVAQRGTHYCPRCQRP